MTANYGKAIRHRVLAPSQTPHTTSCTIGGGHLHRVVWQRSATCVQYGHYTKTPYRCARVVFGGYDTPSTKDKEHMRGIALSREVTIEDDNTHVIMSQQEFLGNTVNKVRFIALLTSHLEAAGCEVHHASADADRLIVLTALAIADSDAVSVLVGDDIDIQVLVIVPSDPARL